MSIEDELREKLLIAESRIISLKNQIAGFIRKYEGREKAISSKVSEKRQTIYKIFKGVCFHCDCKLENKNNKENREKGFVVDHLFPRSYGGKNALTNLVLSCIKCDRKKQNFAPSWQDMRRCEMIHNQYKNEN